MTCPGEDTIARYVDGGLEDAAASALRMHMDACNACRALVAEVAQDVVPPTRVADPLDVGTVIAGKYRVVEIIGTGGMGVVVAATHEELGQKVAIKIVHGESLADRDTVRRFLREGRAAAKLQSDHAVRIYDVGRLPGGAPFLVMEYLEGQDLAAVLRARPLAIEEVVDYMLQAIDAIGEAHSHGLVHRDIKPSNIFLATLKNGDTRVKVLDFGLAKNILGAETREDSALTTEHMFIGSPMFMSPEQIRDPRTVDKRTDIWSIGATLWQLITGEAPFTSGSVQATLAEVCTRALPPISRVRPGVPRSIEDAIARCMQKDREHRFANVEELAIALGGPLRRSSSRRVSLAPTTHPKPTELMPGVNLQVPTVLDRRNMPVFRVTEPMPAQRPVHAAPAPAPAPASSPSPSRAPVFVLFALLALAAAAIVAFVKLRPSLHPGAPGSETSSTTASITVVSPPPSTEVSSASAAPAPQMPVSAAPSSEPAPSSPPASSSSPAAPVVKKTPKKPASHSGAPAEKKDPLYDP